MFLCPCSPAVPIDPSPRRSSRISIAEGRVGDATLLLVSYIGSSSVLKLTSKANSAFEANRDGCNALREKRSAPSIGSPRASAVQSAGSLDQAAADQNVSWLRAP